MPTFEAGVNTTHAVHNLQFIALRTLGGKRNNRLRRAARNSFSTYSFFFVRYKSERSERKVTSQPVRPCDTVQPSLLTWHDNKQAKK